MDVILIRQ